MQAHISSVPFTEPENDHALQDVSFAAQDDGESSGTEVSEPEEDIIINESVPYLHLELTLTILSLGHCLASVALLIAYYQLKV